ncbi:hypothetical protein ACQHIV_11425 [Kribbella sp. GL6]|uniref:hypothetical protein n=1 Tax=Kribbella sp. GL6 TaxID=3419765 RepID=UPI003CFCC4FD
MAQVENSAHAWDDAAYQVKLATAWRRIESRADVPKRSDAKFVLAIGTDQAVLSLGWALPGRRRRTNGCRRAARSCCWRAGTATVAVVERSRPSRFALEIENLPVTGWLVEVEVEPACPVR